jgi:hypothetical protein
MGASVAQDLAVRVLPRGARTVREFFKRSLMVFHLIVW